MELFFFQFPIACVFFLMTMTLDQDLLLYMSTFLEDFHQHHLEGLQMMEDFQASFALRFRPVVVQSHVFAKSGAQGDPENSGGVPGVVGGGGNGSIFPKGCPVGTRDPVAMVGFFIPRISEEIRNQDHLHLFCSNGLVKKPPDPTMFF